MTIARSDWPRLLNLLEQALDLPGCEREAWLRTLDLPATLNEALASLIEERQAIETSGFLADMPALPDSAHAHAPGRFGPGTLIGPWRLLREVGRGGMSTVWLAERADEQLRRQVALKLPHAGPGQDLLAQRLLRERNILAALEHRNIARLYDVGLMDTGTPYLVMEYVAGDTLLAHADARRLTIPQRLALFQQVLRAVQYAHGKLVLHRDLKPSNILVNDAGDVKLLDFGIAKLLLAENGGSFVETELTRRAGHLLTPSYASPEQLRGKPLGTGSDVYSLGVMLYALLCGRGPHVIEGASAARLEDAVLNLEPKAPSRHAVDANVLQARSTSAAGLRKTLAGDLDAIVLKALAKAPEQRYASADALGAELSRWLAGEPIAARAPSAWRHWARFVSRHRWAVALSTAAITLLIAASGVALMQARAATQQAVRATAVRDFLVAMFNETDPDVSRTNELTAKTLLDNGRQRAIDTLKQTPDLMAELLQTVGRAQAQVSDRTAADETLSQAVDIYGRIGNRRGELLTLLEQADNALASGRHQQAQALLDRATARCGACADDRLAKSALLRTQGYVALFARDWMRAKASFERYLAWAETVDEPALEKVQALQNLAVVISTVSDDPSAAMALIQQALQTLNEHPDIAVTAKMDVLQYRQDIEFKWGRYGHIQRSSPNDVRDCERSLSPKSATCLKLKSRLQAAQLRLGLFAQALQLDAELRSMLNPASPRDQAVAAAASVRALAYSGRLAERPDLVTLLEQIATSETLDDAYRLKALNTLAEVHLLAERPTEALAWAAKAMKLAANKELSQTPDGRKAQLLEGVALHKQGQHTRALAAMAYFCSAADRAASIMRVEDHFLSLNCVAPLVASGQSQSALLLLEETLPVLRENFGLQAPTLQRVQHWLDNLQSGRGLPPSGTSAEVLFS